MSEDAVGGTINCTASTQVVSIAKKRIGRRLGSRPMTGPDLLRRSIRVAQLQLDSAGKQDRVNYVLMLMKKLGVSFTDVGAATIRSE